jgi:hypothetical protein
MKDAHLLGTLVLLGALTGCDNSIPPEKTRYVGEWKDVSMQLLITRDGSVEYERVKGSATTKVSGPLRGFVGNDFDVGFGPFSTTFVVSKPPYLAGNEWRMVVDDVELVRVN